MKIAILGFGREGKAVLKYLRKSLPAGRQVREFKNVDISILDKKLDKNYLKNLNRFDLVFRSPGVPYNLPEVQKAIKKGVEFSGSTVLFFQEAKKIGCQIIGITGTKGKGTTATLLYRILKACGKNVYLAGNIGQPAIELLSKIRINQPNQHKSASLVILELSSFQLQDLKKSPDIAVILDIFPDHLDLHKNLREYISAKSAISKFQNLNDKIFYFSNNKYSRFIAQKSRAKKIPVDSTFSNSRELEKVIKIPGEHNFKNAVMAATVALSLGCPKEKIMAAIKKFRGNEHRLELVRTIRINQLNQHKSASIKFYNDSASTNPQTAAAAIRAFEEPKILISGGKDKKLNYSPLAKALKNSNTKLVILFGENKKKIRKAISNQEPVIREVKNVSRAVQLAYKTAKSLITSYQLPVTILFSPASASFDMFKDYADRGEKFKKLVRKLK